MTDERMPASERDKDDACAAGDTDGGEVGVEEAGAIAIVGKKKERNKEKGWNYKD
jgi:hypothetical protein